VTGSGGMTDPLHQDSGPTTRWTTVNTAEALPGIIGGLRAKGLTLAKVSDLIGEAHDERELTDEPAPDGGSVNAR